MFGGLIIMIVKILSVITFVKIPKQQCFPSLTKMVWFHYSTWTQHSGCEGFGTVSHPIPTICSSGVIICLQAGGHIGL